MSVKWGKEVTHNSDNALLNCAQRTIKKQYWIFVTILKNKTNNYNTMIDSATDHVIGARDHRVIVT